MDYIFENDKPIYIQLFEKLRLDIVSGNLKVGEKIPSVRELALKARVNPNTMQKALQDLESQGLIYTERTNGKYVTNDLKLVENIKNELAINKVRKFFNDMKDIGISYNETIKYINEMEEK